MKKKVLNESLRELIVFGMGVVVNFFCKLYGNCLEYSVCCKFIVIKCLFTLLLKFFYNICSMCFLILFCFCFLDNCRICELC